MRDSIMQQGLEEFGNIAGEPPQLPKPKVINFWVMLNGTWKSAEATLADISKLRQAGLDISINYNACK